MELRQLRYFAAVAETRHFGRAAEQLHLAQPALSQAIRQLEAELGTSLFTRTTRHVQVTPAGEFLYRETQRILRSTRDAALGVSRIAAGQVGLVRIAFTGTAAYSLLPRIARLIKSELPGVALEIHADLLTPNQVEGLLDGHLDLGVLRPPVGADTISTRTIAHEPLVVAVAADHALADHTDLRVAELAEEPFVMYADTHSVVNEAVLRSCHAAGFTPRVAHEAPSTAVLQPLVAAGLGVAMVPASVQLAPLRGVVFAPLVDAGTTELALAWRNDTDAPAVDRVLDVITSHDLLAELDPIMITQEVAR